MDELVSCVLAGSIRRKILQSLQQIEKTPTLLSQEIKTHQSTISRTLLYLQQKGLVRCLTPKAKLSRLYAITDTGKKVIAKINQILKTP